MMLTSDLDSVEELTKSADGVFAFVTYEVSDPRTIIIEYNGTGRHIKSITLDTNNTGRGFNRDIITFTDGSYLSIEKTTPFELKVFVSSKIYE